MCLVIDINTLSCVFNENNRDHHEFKPVREWIENKNSKGKIVYGGTEYLAELRKAPVYLKHFTYLEMKGKAVPLIDNEVDECQEEIKSKANDPKFNDTHILAIIIVSKCRILCSIDKKSYPYILNKSYYPNGILRPKIYSNISNKSLLIDKNIATCCK